LGACFTQQHSLCRRSCSFLPSFAFFFSSKKKKRRRWIFLPSFLCLFSSSKKKKRRRWIFLPSFLCLFFSSKKKRKEEDGSSFLPLRSTTVRYIHTYYSVVYGLGISLCCVLGLLLLHTIPLFSPSSTSYFL
jgi:hypothetical protein